jgi:hypothetical protein
MRAPEAELVFGSPVAHARVAGLLGLLALASGSFTGYVSGRLVVRADAALTASNILASELLFRLGIASSLAMMIAFLFYALLLYRLLKPVNRNHALAMLALVVASVPLFLLNQAFQYAALPLARDQLHRELQLFLELHRLGNLIAGLFFGLWLFPLGLLVFRSGFLPRALGLLLMVGSPGYLVLFAQAFFFPGSERTLWTNPLLVVTHLAELATMLWLLAKGVDAGEWPRKARESG